MLGLGEAAGECFSRICCRVLITRHFFENVIERIQKLYFGVIPEYGF